MPTSEDRTDITALREGDVDGLGETPVAGEQKDDSKDEEKMETSLEQERALDSSMEIYENPFLKLTKKGKGRMKTAL